MSKRVKINRGFDIKLEGEAPTFLDATSYEAPTYALKPVEFHNLRGKLLVKQGDEVKAGTPLFYDKNNENARFSSPVSGEVVEINRGHKRVITEIKILPDKMVRHEEYGAADPADLSREQITEKLIQTGCWPFIIQRPFDVIANPEDLPKSIFVSAFSTAPLAPNLDFALKGEEQNFQTGINVLKQLTEGPVHLNVHHELTSPESFFRKVNNVTINEIEGPHPASAIGVQIHHIDPINKGDIVWYVSPQDVVIIGKLFREGIYDPIRVVALTGQSYLKRRYIKTRMGASLAPLLEGHVEEGNNRYISGNVLCGCKVKKDGYLSFFDNQITVIPEGDEPEFQGWLFPSYPRPSISRTFPWTFNPELKFKVNTNMHGEERPFVMTGEYEKVTPMDIYPIFLLKAIMAEDLDAMEGLGIYEVGPEDLALCEFVCTSKTPVQSIVRQGLDLMVKEG